MRAGGAAPSRRAQPSLRPPLSHGPGSHRAWGTAFRSRGPGPLTSSFRECLDSFLSVLAASRLLHPEALLLLFAKCVWPRRHLVFGQPQAACCAKSTSLPVLPALASGLLQDASGFRHSGWRRALGPWVVTTSLSVPRDPPRVTGLFWKAGLGVYCVGHLLSPVQSDPPNWRLSK